VRTGATRLGRTRPGRWTFVHDQLATGTKLRVLTIVDTFLRFSPALEPRLFEVEDEVVKGHVTDAASPPKNTNIAKKVKSMVTEGPDGLLNR